MGINNARQIVGSYSDSSGKVHGFARSADGSTYATIDPPGSIYSNPSDINDAGQIVGDYEDSSGNWHGFIAYPKSYLFETVDDPVGVVSSRGTNVLGINDAGQLVWEVHRLLGPDSRFPAFGRRFVLLHHRPPPSAFPRCSHRDQ